MKVLWVGDAVVSSGFARCTHAACDALHKAGHKVDVLGINYFGDPHNFPYPIYPCSHPLAGGNDGFGLSRLPLLVEKLEPDLIVLLNDPWNIQPYIEHLDEYFTLPVSIPIVGWIAVDACNHDGIPLDQLSHVAVWTQFAIDELNKGGYTGESSIIPLGVDGCNYYPRNKVESRKEVGIGSLPDDAFVVVVVGRNQPRKRIDLSIQFFAKWIERYSLTNVYLLLHVAPTGDLGCNIRRLVQYYNVSSRVILSDPKIGSGIDESSMSALYSACDVYLSTCQGEGFGLPTLEAMSCGLPCVVPNWSGLGSWVGDAAWLVECPTRALSAPMNNNPYTIGGVPDMDGTIVGLHKLYSSEETRDLYRDRGLKLSNGMQWDDVGRKFTELLESIIPSDSKSTYISLM